jgi:hypothetical protein
MSLWTPSGEHPVGDEPPKAGPSPGPAGEPGTGAAGGPDAGDPAVSVEELRQQLAEAPPEVVVANHCYGLFELAAVYLSQSPPLLPQAQLAIDALGYLVDGLGSRLGEAQRSLQEALAQVRLAYVQLDKAEQARQTVGNGN